VPPRPSSAHVPPVSPARLNPEVAGLAPTRLLPADASTRRDPNRRVPPPPQICPGGARAAELGGTRCWLPPVGLPVALFRGPLEAPRRGRCGGATLEPTANERTMGLLFALSGSRAGILARARWRRTIPHRGERRGGRRLYVRCAVPQLTADAVGGGGRGLSPSLLRTPSRRLPSGGRRQPRAAEMKGDARRSGTGT
jgi:hypothetical protein